MSLQGIRWGFPQQALHGLASQVGEFMAIVCLVPAGEATPLERKQHRRERHGPFHRPGLSQVHQRLVRHGDALPDALTRVGQLAGRPHRSSQQIAQALEHLIGRLTRAPRPPRREPPLRPCRHPVNPDPIHARLLRQARLHLGQDPSEKVLDDPKALHVRTLAAQPLGGLFPQRVQNLPERRIQGDLAQELGHGPLFGAPPVNDLTGLDGPALGDHRGSIDAADLILDPAVIPALNLHLLGLQLGLQHLAQSLPSPFAMQRVESAPWRERPPVVLTHQDRAKHKAMVMMLGLVEPILSVAHGEHQGATRGELDPVGVIETPPSPADPHRPLAHLSVQLLHLGHVNRQGIVHPSTLHRRADFTRHRGYDFAGAPGNARCPGHQQSAGPVPAPYQHLRKIRRENARLEFLRCEPDLKPQLCVMEHQPDLPVARQVGRRIVGQGARLHRGPEMPHIPAHRVRRPWSSAGVGGREEDDRPGHQAFGDSAGRSAIAVSWVVTVRWPKRISRVRRPLPSIPLAAARVSSFLSRSRAAPFTSALNGRWRLPAARRSASRRMG